MNTEYFQKIEDYLFGNLSESDKQVFETEIANNETLATDVALQSLGHRAMKLAVRDDLRAQMSAWKQENLEAEITTQEAKIVQMPQPSAKVVPLSRRLFMWAAAASVLIIAVVAGRQLLMPSRSSLEIAQGFYENPSLASKGIVENTILNESKNLINQGKYREAIKNLDALQDSATQIQRLFLLGHAHFKQNNFLLAAQTFQQIPAHTTDTFDIQRAEWLLLISKLATGQKDKSFEDLLDKIRLSNSIYSDKAKELQGILK